MASKIKGNTKRCATQKTVPDSQPVTGILKPSGISWGWGLTLDEPTPRVRKKPYSPKNMASKIKGNTKSCATQKTVPDFYRYRPRIAKRTRYAKRKGGYRKPPTSNFGSLRVMQINVQSDREVRAHLPTFTGGRGVLFRPDIALISSDLEESTTREVLDDVRSDHLPSLITINCCASAQGWNNKPKWNYRKANWGVYRDTLDDALSKVLPDNTTISVLNEAFTRAVIHAARRGIP
ncbi:RNA-directed DNA polymerase from mobile element jockey-like [Plakobranchus ocellatus]|uniref:RNA-directed DNA polymerase from mobile element jockey-like n=1 Tax=Plakobranchus ocellatus TaxID=259542 RepID=A0AAV4B0Q5_9GAST|nr:RNA-directed DNA polymerase from mobile element jockey-like [Plakobranchus ocellatus]